MSTRLIKVPIRNWYRHGSVHIIGLILITFVAGVLRYYKLGEWSFWIDEVLTLDKSREVFQTPFLSWVRNYPSTATLIHASVSALGENEWTARLAPAIIGTLTIPILFIPIKKISGTRVALLTGLLLAFSHWHLYWSQNARFYVMLLLYFNLSLFTFYLGLEKDRAGYFVISLVFLAFAISESLLGLFLVPIMVSYLLLIRLFPFDTPLGYRWQNINILFVPALLFGMVFGWEYIRSPGTWENIYFGFTQNGPQQILSQTIRSTGIPIVSLGGVAAIILLWKRERIGLLLTTSIVIPWVIVVLASSFQFAHSRYTFVSLASWAVLASYAADMLCFAVQKEGRIVGAVALLSLFIFWPLQNEVKLYYETWQGDRPNWRDAFQFVEENYLHEDLIVTNDPTVGQYYTDYKMVWMKQIEPETTPEAMKNSKYRTWFVVGGNSRADQALLTWVIRHSELVYSDSHQLKVYLFLPEE